MTIMESIRGAFEQWMVFESTSVLDVTAGAVMANRMSGGPIFLVIIGPSGSGKSEIIESLSDVRGVFPLSDLTPNTFLSGKMDAEHSLLLKLPKGQTTIFALKDFTTLFQNRSDDQGKIFAQLREIYDGSMVKPFGGTKTKVWKGKCGLIAGCVGSYDSVSQKFSRLGERYLLHRPLQPDSFALAEKAGREAHERDAMKKDLRRAMKQLDNISIPAKIDISPEIHKYLSELAEFVAHMRTPVPRDPYTRKIVEKPAIEGGGRISAQFHDLIRGIAVAREKKAVEDVAEVELMEEVAISCIPSTRLEVVKFISKYGCTVRELANFTRLPKTNIHRELQDLHLLGLLDRIGEGEGYMPAKAFGRFFTQAGKMARGEANGVG